MPVVLAREPRHASIKAVVRRREGEQDISLGIHRRQKAIPDSGDSINAIW
jgi:hypothetical protein